MKQQTTYPFKIGDYVFWQRQKDGLYIIKEIQNRGMALPPLMLIERLYDTNYNKCTGNKKDREYQVDATYLKIVIPNDILLFEQKKLERVQKMVKTLNSLVIDP